MNIVDLFLIPCPMASIGCGDPIGPILPQFVFPSPPFWIGAAVLVLCALVLLAIVGGSHSRMAIILTIATPAIFIAAKLALAGIYIYWIAKGKPVDKAGLQS